MAPTRLILLRHGWTRWNHEHRYNSRTDLPLTDKGTADARAAGRFLDQYQIDSVVSSPMRRARRTAELVNEQLGSPALDIGLIDDLQEMDFGVFEGLNPAEIKSSEMCGEYLAWRGSTTSTPAAPGGESWPAAEERADRLLRRFSAGQGTSLVVSHGYILRLMVIQALGIPYGQAIRRIRLDNTAMSELELTDYGWRVNRHNVAAGSERPS